jgi:hypothetical protein
VSRVVQTRCRARLDPLAFVQLRDLLASNTELARRLGELEHKLEGQDTAITAILAAIRELMNPPDANRRAIGFTADVEPSRSD